MELIDTHCHLDVPEFAADRAAVRQRSGAAGLVGIVIPAIHADGWSGLLALCTDGSTLGPALYPALGLHPVYLDQHRETDIAALERAVADARPVAIGEIGLDYVVRELDPARQQALFEAQLEIARSAGLPVLLHVRKAHDEVLTTLRRLPVVGGVAHAFNGSLQQAQQYRDLGFKLGFGGMLTFERSTRLRRLAAQIPLESIVLETDAPDLTVAAHRGERNSPEYLTDVLAALARVRDADPGDLAALTTANARAVLNLP
ncbi:TatD family hydrolase [Thiocystis violascens]|uniref:Mg-dependent DNase n=1 Tax=Thiocystis violascens (strain ATCC 17096 / DSM 198 / 6111) TaxID=765911 RepID=I3Y9W2_THIV6|nr:TatD family hydrolase [Thiocystis violascens]AFL73780.1 Mg-dependent DNase [Thiocystis violascens DSM 198]